jgi:hypothetical protein
MVVHKNLFFLAAFTHLSTRFVEKYILGNIWWYHKYYRMEIRGKFHSKKWVFTHPYSVSQDQFAEIYDNVLW